MGNKGPGAADLEHHEGLMVAAQITQVLVEDYALARGAGDHILATVIANWVMLHNLDPGAASAHAGEVLGRVIQAIVAATTDPEKRAQWERTFLSLQRASLRN